MSRHACWEMCLSPLHRHARKASTPAPAACRRFGSEGSTFGFPFRPRGFAPPRRFPPLYESRACCIPLPILGFSAFPLWSPGRRPERYRAFPRCRIRTPRRNPLRQPLRVTASVAPLPFSPDHRPISPESIAGFSSVGVGGPGASASRPCSVVRVWCLARAVAGVRDPLLPGLFSSSRFLPDDRRSCLPSSFRRSRPSSKGEVVVRSSSARALRDRRPKPGRGAPRRRRSGGEVGTAPVGRFLDLPRRNPKILVGG